MNWLRLVYNCYDVITVFVSFIGHNLDDGLDGNSSQIVGEVCPTLTVSKYWVGIFKSDPM